MGNFPNITPKELLNILRARGYIILRQRGSHVLLQNSINSQQKVTIPIHNKTLKRGTLLSILRQTGLKKEDLR